LVLGWVAFWLGAVVYPCQAHRGAPPTPDAPAVMAMSSGMLANGNQLDPCAAHANGTCQALTAPSIGLSVAAAASADIPAPAAPAAVAFEARRFVPTAQAFYGNPALQPPPHTALYLRVQRLLI
jgi:hypothetical protein